MKVTDALQSPSELCLWMAGEAVQVITAYLVFVRKKMSGEMLTLL